MNHMEIVVRYEKGMLQQQFPKFTQLDQFCQMVFCANPSMFRFSRAIGALVDLK